MASKLERKRAAATGNSQKRLTKAALILHKAPGTASPETDPTVEERVNAWLDNVDDEIAEADQVKTNARESGEVERSAALLSNAVTTLSTSASRAVGAGSGASTPEPVAADGVARPFGLGSDFLHPRCSIEAQVELGRLQLEQSLQKGPPGSSAMSTAAAAAAAKWEATGPDVLELRGMKLAERYSNVLNGKHHHVVFSVPDLPEGEDEALEKDVSPSGKDTAATQNAAADATLPFEEIGRGTLCRALVAAVASRHFVAAQRALSTLALYAYGVSYPEATFELLIWLQSVDVCNQAEELFSELMPPDHQERVQIGLLRRLEHDWLNPAHLQAYESIKRRLQHESPLFQRIQLADLPSIPELLLTHLPPLTLVVTLQVRDHYLYVGAACSSQEGDREHRLQNLTHKVSRRYVCESDLQAYINKMQELNLAIEKELIVAPVICEHLSAQLQTIVSHLEEWLLQPIAEGLGEHFWPYSPHIENPGNPKRMLLLPDSMISNLPLECSPSFNGLFGTMGHSSLSRDISLHVAAHRVHTYVGSSDSEKQALKVPIATMRNGTMALLTDPFNEDMLGSSDNPKSESMCMLHERLVQAKIIGNAAQSFQGQMFTASAEDIKGILADSSAFLSLGFSRFNATMPSRDFMSQDLRRLSLLALFQRCINDPSFRRQTKTDSMKTIWQLTAENSFNVPLIAAFRGVQCTVVTRIPVPASITMRCCEVFARAVHGGKTITQAMEEVLVQQVNSVEMRYARTLEGGEFPGAVSSVDAPSKKASPTPDSSVNDAPHVDLLPPYMLMAFVVVGVPWIFSEPDPAAAGAKKK